MTIDIHKIVDSQKITMSMNANIPQGHRPLRDESRLLSERQ